MSETVEFYLALARSVNKAVEEARDRLAEFGTSAAAIQPIDLRHTEESS